MKKLYALVFLLALCAPLTASGREVKLVRYPHYHHGRIAFTYLADIWTADENGQNVQRMTVNKARDVYPRFSPDGKWIAFSSDRNGNLMSSSSRRRRQRSTDVSLGRRHRAGLDARFARRAVRFQSRRRLHGQALHRDHRRRHAAQCRHRHGRAGGLFARRQEAGDQPQGTGLLAQVLSRLVSDRRHGDGRRGEEVHRGHRLRRAWIRGRCGARTASSTSSATAKATA